MINLEKIFLYVYKSQSCIKVQLIITMSIFYTGTFPKTCVIWSCSGHLLFMAAKNPFPLLLKWCPELSLGKLLLRYWIQQGTINQDVPISLGQGMDMWPKLYQSDAFLSLEFKAHMECGERWKKQLELINPIGLWLPVPFHFPHGYLWLLTFPRMTLRLCKDVPYSSILQHIPLCLLRWDDFCFLCLKNPNW